jgi:hypothetical protein
MSAGTREFWVVDPEKRSVFVTDSAGVKTYGAGDTIPVRLFESTVFVDRVFDV